MADAWYYASDHIRFGPFSARELHDLADLGRIQPMDTVWKEGVAEGVPAGKVKYLFSPFPDDLAAGGPTPDGQPHSAEVGTAPAVLDTPLAPAAPAVENPTPAGVPAVPARAKTGRAVAVKGAVILSQNGATVKFLKKCTACGHQDSSWNTIPIKNGTTRVPYFCPRCKKNRDVEVRGSVY